MEILRKSKNGQWSLEKARKTSEYGNFGGGSSFNGGDQHIQSDKEKEISAKLKQDLPKELEAAKKRHEEVANRGEKPKPPESIKTVKDHPLHRKLVDHFIKNHGLHHRFASDVATQILSSDDWRADESKPATGAGAATAQKILSGKLKTQVLPPE